jgi:hypothetical protein
MHVHIRVALFLAVVTVMTNGAVVFARGPLDRPGKGTDDGSGKGTDDGSGSGSDNGSGSGTDSGSGSGSSGSGSGNGSGGGGQQPLDCEAWRCAVEDVITAACPCDGSPTHGAYVRCVAKTVKDLAAARTLPKQCKSAVVACAARSACGKRRIVACHIPSAGGEADLCRFRSVASCSATGGVADHGSCCAECPPPSGGSPSGAFIDSVAR